ncbi:MAG: hypothetical protein KJZ59_08660 [Pararhodobacter sp.]|nr:hypothetical protein [Pararhodobacter sp.]
MRLLQHRGPHGPRGLKHVSAGGLGQLFDRGPHGPRGLKLGEIVSQRLKQAIAARTGRAD